MSDVVRCIDVTGSRSLHRSAARDRLQSLVMILDGGSADEMNAYIKRETD